MSDWPSPANDPLAVDGEPPKTPSDGDLPPAQAQPGGWRHVGLAALALLLAGLIASRFIGLDHSPPGFYVDEAAIAAQVMCLRSTGGDAQGKPWPLFAEVLGGGQASPPTLYLGAAWTALFGDSVASFRALAAAAGLGVVLGVAGAAAVISGRVIALPIALLVAVSSPWLFHLSRVFWDPIMAAALWAAALAAYFWASRHGGDPGAPRRIGWMLFGVLSIAAAYAYPPVRIQVGVSWALLALFDQGFRQWRGWLWAAIPAALLAIPLLSLYADAGFRGRGSMLAIWNPRWLSDNGHALVDLPLIAIQQLGAHLSPGYLFAHGDTNLRHGSGYGGLIGAVEIAVLAAALLLGRWPGRAFGLLLALTLAGILPAALTWESTPHALRSLGATGPWLMAVSLAATSLVTAKPLGTTRVLAGLAAIALISATLYGLDYHARYRQAAAPWFDVNARPHDDPRYPALARRYFEMRDGQPCLATP